MKKFYDIAKEIDRLIDACENSDPLILKISWLNLMKLYANCELNYNLTRKYNKMVHEPENPQSLSYKGLKIELSNKRYEISVIPYNGEKGYDKAAS